MLKTVATLGGGGGNGSGTVTEVDTAGGLTGGPITTAGTVSIANTTVTAGTYGNNTAVPQIIVNSRGQITSASNVSISAGSGTVSSVGLSLPSFITVSGSPVTTAGTLTGTLANQTQNLVFASPNAATGQPAFRALVAGDIPALAYVSNVATSTGLTGGPVTSTGTISLANTAVTAGVYGDTLNVPQITIDQQGRITSAANVAISAGGSGTVTNIATGTGLTGGPITTTGTVSIANTAVSVGNYGANGIVGTFTVNQQGQLTAAGNVGITIPAANLTTTVGQAGGGTGITTSSNGITTTDLIFIVDGGGNAITTGIKGYQEVPFACTINRWTLLGDQSGNVTIDVFNNTYATYGNNTSTIGAGVKPSTSAATKNQSAPASWTSTTITAGNIVGINVTAVATFTRLTVALNVTRT